MLWVEPAVRPEQGGKWQWLEGGLTAETKADVRTAYDAALANGGADNGPPGGRPWRDDYYGGYVAIRTATRSTSCGAPRICWDAARPLRAARGRALLNTSKGEAEASPSRLAASGSGVPGSAAPAAAAMSGVVLVDLDHAAADMAVAAAVEEVDHQPDHRPAGEQPML